MNNENETPVGRSSTTFAILKPDIAYQQDIVGEVLIQILEDGFRIRSMQMRQLIDVEVAIIYAQHVHQPYWPAHRDFMTSGQSLLMVLERLDANAVTRWRELMRKIRATYGTNVTINAVHGSDSDEAASLECYWAQRAMERE